MPTLEDAISLIRKHDCLKGWSDLLIKYRISQAIQSAALTFTLDGNNKLTGLVFGRWQDNGRLLHVTVCIGRLRDFLGYLRTTFPGCEELTAYRQGNFVTYKLKDFKHYGKP
jgi:hypothetical protein